MVVMHNPNHSLAAIETIPISIPPVYECIESYHVASDTASGTAVKSNLYFCLYIYIYLRQKRTVCDARRPSVVSADV